MFTTVLLVFVILLLIILAIGGGIFFYVYWWLVQRPVPKLDGEVRLPGLNATVEVLRDKHAIPHIYAADRADLFRAQGYLHAQDRLWQMEQNRRIAYGTLAEVYGEAALEADRFSRIVGFRRAAEAELAALDGETRQSLDWYAEGVNAFIAAHPGKLGAEFNLLRVQPTPWQALDTVAFTKVVAWGLSINWESELLRLRLLQQLGPMRAAELEPDYPAQNPAIVEGVGSQELTRLLHTAGLLLNQYEELKQWLGHHGDGKGSNSWALAPSRSLNRRPILCNDPHMTLQMPGIWYENHLCAPDYEVSGVSFPGAPGVVIGHNAEIAWGITAAQVDVQDLYLERAHPGDATRFDYCGSWEEAQVLEETIVVRRRPQPHVERVTITRHGPLIGGLLSPETGADALPHVPLALRWTGHAPGNSLRAILRLNQAATWEEFDSALADWSTPPNSFTFADAGGNIGTILAGAVPNRERNLGLTPAPGWTGQHEWGDSIPHAELPRLFNPESGLVVTANHKPVGDDYPYFLGVEFYPGWRAARLEELLQKKERHTLRDMEQLQLDVGSKYAEALAPWLAQLNSDDIWEKAALTALRNWNHRMDPDSEAALVFHYMLLHLLDLVFGDKLGAAEDGYRGIAANPLFLVHGFMLRAELRLWQLLDGEEQSVWYGDAAGGGRRRTREELLQEALTRAVRDIRSAVGDSMRKWDWGRSHQIRYVHPMGSVRLLGGFFNRGPFPIGGDGTTPNVARHAPRLPLGLVQVTASYRQILEVGVWDRAQSVTTNGQSGHPLSDHYDDQIAMFREGAYHPTPWSRQAVEKAAVYRLTLRP